jgi:hypothetical protein
MSIKIKEEEEEKEEQEKVKFGLGIYAKHSDFDSHPIAHRDHATPAKGCKLICFLFLSYFRIWI